MKTRFLTPLLIVVLTLFISCDTKPWNSYEPSPSVSILSFASGGITITGTNLKGVTDVSIENDSQNVPFQITQQSESQILAYPLSLASFVFGGLYRLTLVKGLATQFPITIEVADGSITAAKLAQSYVPVNGGTMTGTLNLPSNGLTVGTNQLVVSSGKVGIGTASPASTLDVQGSLSMKVNTITTSTTLNDTHHIVFANNSSDIAVTLPAAVSGRSYYIKKTSNNTSTVTLTPNGVETIDGASSLVLYVNYDGVRIVSDGTHWQVVSDERIAHGAKMHQTITQSISHNTFTNIDFDTIDFNVGGLASTDANTFTIKRSGRYLVSAFWLTASQANNGDRIDARIAIDNDIKLAEFIICGGGNCSASVDGVLDLVAGEVLQFEVFVFHGSSMTTYVLEPFRVAPRMSVQEIR